MTLPSQEYLISRIDYNPETGEASWKPVDESYGLGWKQFNTRYAGQVIPYSFRLQNSRYTLPKAIHKLLTGEDRKPVVRAIAPKLTIVKPPARVIELRPIPDAANDLIYYDHVTGNLLWKHRSGNSRFNKLYANKIAGSLNKANGYIKINVNDTIGLGAHRVIWKLYYGIDPGNYQIDHIDGTRSNNCISNLRLATGTLNTSAAATNSKGYSLNKRHNRFSSSIMVKGTPIFLGYFDTDIEAKEAYNLAVELYKPFYKFTQEEQAQLDLLYATYPNCDPNLQKLCHAIQVKAVKYFDDAAIVQTPNLEYNSNS